MVDGPILGLDAWLAPEVAVQRHAARQRSQERKQRRETPPAALEPRYEVITAPAIERDAMMARNRN